MPTLYVVATPIGNLEDITFRALRVLKEVDVILCEDTRVTRHLLDSYDISYEKLLSYHAHSKLTKVEKILGLLREGKNLALVSDAGTPAISDPGAVLVGKIREGLPNVEIISIPGPNAAVATLSIAGVPASDFLFLGFLPHKKGRQTLFKEIASSKRTVVFYESPHRILKTLQALLENLTIYRKVLVARELTKLHEELVSGSPAEVLAYFHKNPAKIRGEFVVLVAAKH